MHFADQSYGREIKERTSKKNISSRAKYDLSITCHLNERISLFSLVALRLMVYFNTRIPHNNSLDVCTSRAQARKTGHQSSSSLLSMLRAEDSLLFAAVSLYTVRMPMSVHNYRFSIRQVHRCVSASLEKNARLCFSPSRRSRPVSRPIFLSRRAFA